VKRPKSGTSVLNEQLVTEEDWYEVRARHLRIDTYDSNHNS
jgi:hypothetical protein